MKRLLVATLVSLATLASGSARATMIAGWDFSQYLGDNFLSIDGATTANTLSANYSNLDPTGGAGAESAAYGTMYLDGSFGSSLVDAFDNPQVVPTAGSLISNISAPGLNPFDSLTILTDEGQANANLLALTSPLNANVVFAANTTPTGKNGSSWGLTFGGKTFSGTSTVGVQVSTDGSTYVSAGSANLTTTDTLFSVLFPAITAKTIYVRLQLAPGNGQPIIDNVALSATLPEPTTLVVIGTALAGLGLLRRRHAA